MRTIRDAWIIVQGDFRGDKLRLLWAFLFSVIFMGYLAGLTGMVTDDALDQNDRTAVADFLLLSLIPILGFTFSRRTMKYFSDDSYTKMLAYLRSLPIPPAVILCKRKLQSIFSFCLNGLLYFGLMYAISGNLRTVLPWPSYLSFALTWIGYGLMLTGIYIFIEFLFSGKAYFWLTLLIMLLSWGVSLLIKLAGGNLFFYTLSCSKDWGLLSPLMWGSLLLGAISVQLFSKWTIHRLQSRNLV
jgi:hypothetical protein